LWSQVDVFFDVEELPSDDLLHISLNYVDFAFKLALFSLDDVQCVAPEVRVLSHVLWL